MILNNQFPNVLPILPPASPKSLRDIGFMAHKWSYPEERLGETVESDGERIKKMLTLDLNIPNGAFAETVNMARLGEATQAFRGITRVFISVQGASITLNCTIR